MSSTNSDTVDILGYKLCDLMSELFTVHKSERFIPPQTDEPWSSDMSGPYKYAGKNWILLRFHCLQLYLH